MSVEMKTLTIGSNTYEIVDEQARASVAQAVKTVNGVAPDETGNVVVAGGTGSAVTIDDTLSVEGQAADAKATGNALARKLAANQGSDNVGKYLGISSDGAVMPVDAPEGGTVELDTTLSVSGQAADAKVVGDKFDALSEEIANVGGGDSTASVEPTEADIPKVFFGNDLPQSKTDTIMSFRYISKTDDISGYCITKAQGNSSMSYPKKNQTVKMYADAECTKKLKVNLKGWGEQTKHCYKANWIDLTHARNIVSGRLWADMVKTRSNYDELPEELRTSPNQGAVDGFPVKVYANGIYQGRYTLNIPKDKWMANMDDALDTHCILCGENYVSGCFRATANIDGTDWTDEIHDAVPDSIKARWNEAISFVINSTDAEFQANLGNYFDIPSLIDYHLFGLASCGLDAYGKNQLYMTYDGQKWIASMYDMDSTWGLYFDGSKIVATDYARTQYEDFRVSGRQGNLLYIRLEQLFHEELQSRWAELKNGALSIANIINRFERFTDIAPVELVKEDYASTTGGGKFTGIPSQSSNNIQQIRSFALARQAWTDAYVAALNGDSGGDDSGEEETTVSCTGITLSASTLTFTTEGTQTLTATVTPDGCTDEITWESDNTSTATVENGVVTAVGNGNATITARCGNYSASCSVVVSGFASTTYTLTKGYTLSATDGTESVYDAGFISDYIAVPENSAVTVECSSAWVNICAYDADKQYKKTLATKAYDKYTNSIDETSLVGVSFIRVSCENSTATSATAKVTFQESNAIIYEMTNGITLASTGETKTGSATNYALEEYVPVANGKTYTVTTLGVWLDIKGYDSEKAFVSALNTANSRDTSVTVTIPEGISYIRWACTGGDSGATKIVES